MSGCANSAKGEKPVTSFTITTKAVQITAPVTTQSRYTTTADARLKAYMIITETLAAMRAFFVVKIYKSAYPKICKTENNCKHLVNQGCQNSDFFPYTSEKNFQQPVL